LWLSPVPWDSLQLFIGGAALIKHADL